MDPSALTQKTVFHSCFKIEPKHLNSPHWTVQQAISHLKGPVKKTKVGREERDRIVQVIERVTKEGTLTIDDYVSLLQKWLGMSLILYLL
jgi:hypothetical protein